MQCTDALGISRGQLLGDISSNIATGKYVPLVAQLLKRISENRCHSSDAHSFLAQLLSERKARKCGHNDMNIGKQRQYPLESEHGIWPAVQEDDDGS
jgi:hypothetical protein